MQTNAQPYGRTARAALRQVEAGVCGCPGPSTCQQALSVRVLRSTPACRCGFNLSACRLKGRNLLDRTYGRNRRGACPCASGLSRLGSCGVPRASCQKGLTASAGRVHPWGDPIT